MEGLLQLTLELRTHLGLVDYGQCCRNVNNKLHKRVHFCKTNILPLYQTIDNEVDGAVENDEEPAQRVFKLSTPRILSEKKVKHIKDMISRKS